MHYRIGLDIGIASVGWCALETGDDGEPIRIIDLGSRIFDAAEQPKTGASLAAPRREARGHRRTLRRKRFRTDRTRELLARFFGQETVERLDENAPIDLLAVRKKGLDERLSAEETGRLCVYFARHRGYKSNSASEDGKDDDKNKKMLAAIKTFSSEASASGLRTLGEYLYFEREEAAKNGKSFALRNKAGGYERTPLRSDIQAEIAAIFAKQVELGAVTSEFAEEYEGIFSSQRSFDEGPAAPSKYRGFLARSVGECTFEPNEKRAPNGAYSVEYSVALERLNNLRFDVNGERREITDDERTKIVELIRTKKEVKLSAVRKVLGLGDEATSNFDKRPKKDEKKPDSVIFKMTASYDIREALGDEKRGDIYLLDEIAVVLATVKSDEKRRERLGELGLESDEVEKLIGLDVKKFSNLSLKARRKITPFLESGCGYAEACEKAGYTSGGRSERLKKLRGEEIKKIIDDVGSPVVRRAISQTIKVINALVDAYGSPIGVNIEVARELAKTFVERKEIDKNNQNRESENARLVERIKEYKLAPSGLDILKQRLYDEQGGKCAYSGEPLDIAKLFGDENYAQVDHILPFSRSFDDGFNNKALVLTRENQNKGARTPYEYFGGDEKRWSDFVALITSFGTASKTKLANYQKKSFDERAAREWRERNLNDTKYVTRLALGIVNDYLLTERRDGEKENARKVVAVSGFITSYLRKFWGLTKVRDDGDKHHALDAAVIATVSHGLVAKVTSYNKQKECFFRRPNGQRVLKGGMEQYFTRDEQGRFVDVETGLLLDRDSYDQVMGKDSFPKPYPSFRDELLIRLNAEGEFSSRDLDRLRSFGYDDEALSAVRPIFVSRMPDRKVTGSIHKESTWSEKHRDDGIIVRKKPLTDLKLDKDGEIDGYFNREDDKLLYEAIKARLVECGGDGKKAFAKPFYKPKSDGTDGPIVRSVKVYEKVQRGLSLGDRGYVARGDMVRVDVFTKNGKFYCVPVYVCDVASGVLPNKAIKDGEWDEMDESYEFLFSLYKNDLVYVEKKSPFKLTTTNKKEKQTREICSGYFYYGGIDSATGSVNFRVHDNSYDTRLGVKTLNKFKKYVVDVLGNVHEVKKEKRMPLRSNNRKFKADSPEK